MRHRIEGLEVIVSAPQSTKLRGKIWDAMSGRRHNSMVIPRMSQNKGHIISDFEIDTIHQAAQELSEPLMHIKGERDKAQPFRLKVRKVRQAGFLGRINGADRRGEVFPVLFGDVTKKVLEQGKSRSFNNLTPSAYESDGVIANAAKEAVKVLYSHGLPAQEHYIAEQIGRRAKALEAKFEEEGLIDRLTFDAVPKSVELASHLTSHFRIDLKKLARSIILESETYSGITGRTEGVPLVDNILGWFLQALAPEEDASGVGIVFDMAQDSALANVFRRTHLPNRSSFGKPIDTSVIKKLLFRVGLLPGFSAIPAYEALEATGKDIIRQELNSKDPATRERAHADIVTVAKDIVLGQWSTVNGRNQTIMHFPYFN